MHALHDEHPQYGFDQHVGYATPRHLASLAEHGPSAIHRRSFAPVRAAFEARQHGRSLSVETLAAEVLAAGFSMDDPAASRSDDPAA